MMKSYIPCLSDAMHRMAMVLPCCLRGRTGGQTIICDQSYITCDLGEGTVTKDPITLNAPHTRGIIRGGRPGQVDCGSRSTCSR